MFEGTEEELKQTKVTQPAIFLHSTILAACLGDSFQPDMVAGHSLGEISALVANKTLSFEDGLRLVSKRALAMQEACEREPSTMAAILGLEISSTMLSSNPKIACEREPSTMAAILGLEDNIVEEICASISGVVVPANYNCPGQLVISGSVAAVEEACAKLTEAGAKRALILPVGGAFHSPLMEPAREELAAAIKATTFHTPICPVYKNVTANGVTDPVAIQENLVAQLTAPVRWTQTMNQMIADGCTEVIEVGPGKVLQGLFKKVDRAFPTSSAEL